jgi:hypothetical protein
MVGVGASGRRKGRLGREDDGAAEWASLLERFGALKEREHKKPSYFNEPRWTVQRMMFRWDAHRMAFWEKKTIMIAAKVHTPAGNGTLHYDTLASGSVAPNFERLKFRGARRRLAAAE